MKKILMVTSFLGASVAGSDKIMAMELDPKIVQEILFDTHGQSVNVRGVKEQDELNQAIALSRSVNEAVTEEKKILRKVLTDSQREYLGLEKEASVDPEDDSEDNLKYEILLAKVEVESLKNSPNRFSGFNGEDTQLEAAKKKLETLEKKLETLEKKLETLENFQRKRNGVFKPGMLDEQKAIFESISQHNSPSLERKPSLLQSSPTIIIGSGNCEASNPRDADAGVQEMLWEDIRNNSGNNSLNNSRNNSTRTTPVNSPPRPVKILNPDAVKAYKLKNTNLENKTSKSEKTDQKQKSSPGLVLPATSSSNSSSNSSSTSSPRRKILVTSNKAQPRRNSRIEKSSTSPSSDSISPSVSWEKNLEFDQSPTPSYSGTLPSDLSDSQFFKVVESGKSPLTIAVPEYNEKRIKEFDASPRQLEENEIDLSSLVAPLYLNYDYYTLGMFIPTAQEPVFLKARISSWKKEETKISVSQLFLLSGEFKFTLDEIKKTIIHDEEQYMVSTIFNNDRSKSNALDAEGRLWLYVGIPMKFEKISSDFPEETVRMLKACNPKIFFQEDNGQTMQTIKKFFKDISEEDCLTLFARLISFKSAKQ